MTNQSCLNQTRHVPRFIIAIAVLTLAFATSIGPAFAQVATTSSLKIGIIGSGNMRAHWETVDERRLSGALLPSASRGTLDPRGAEIEIVLLKERPNFKPEKFIDNYFLQGGAEGAGG